MKPRSFLRSFLPRLASVSYAMDAEGTTLSHPIGADRVVDNRVEFAARYRRMTRQNGHKERLERLMGEHDNKLNHSMK